MALPSAQERPKDFVVRRKEESCMELTLARQGETQVLVTCDGQASHTFDVRTLIPGKQGLPQPLDDPVAYGKAVYQALFPTETVARRELDALPERILLIATDDTLDAISWEYAYGLYGADDVEHFLVLSCHFVRGLPPDQRIEPPALPNSLHIVAIPSNPLSHQIEPLDIDAEWLRLKEIVQEIPQSITLECARPPTVEQVRRLVANQRHRVVHFMGHGGQYETGAVLCFEKDNGDLQPVTAREFVMRVRATVFLVTLNACVSATPGPTIFSNLASALVRQKVPYALGMRFSIHDDDARAFSRTFYTDLAHGSPVEEALLQARLTLANSQHSWVVGVPVLFTSLAQPAAGFAALAGSPIIKEHQPHIEVSALPRAEGGFQGRINELKVLGTALTGDSCSRLVTIHGAGGQGKTALAREAVERFAYAWPGGIWSASLENLPSQALFINDLARFLGIDAQTMIDPNEIERQVLKQLVLRRTLLVLDNVETLINAVEANHVRAIQLAQFLQQLPGPSVSMLVTSRVPLGWSGEITHELGGLSPEEGAILFQQSAPQRANEIELALAKELSCKLEGHPLGLRLLGGAFNACPISLRTFIEDWEAQLAEAENKYLGPEHRHRTLNACIEMSVRYLDDNLRVLLSGLWVFHAPFLAEAAAAIFNPEHKDTEEHPFPLQNRLYILWQRGLLVRETVTVREGILQFYRLLPIMRPYVEHLLEQHYAQEELLARFGAICAGLVNGIYDELDRSTAAVTIAQQSREDLERGKEYVAGIQQGYYLLHWGRILHRLGDPMRGLRSLEHALEIAQGQDQSLEGQALNNMAAVYYDMRQPKKALELDEQAISILRKVGDRASEAAVLTNIALGLGNTGKHQQAMELYEQALQIMLEVKDRAGEAAILNNIGAMYSDLGQPQQALKRYEQALPIKREVEERLGEGYVLNNMGTVYRDMGKMEQALELYWQALIIRREMGDRINEATTLSLMGKVYKDLEQFEKALELLEQAMTIMREIGDRNREYATLNEMVQIYQRANQPSRVLELLTRTLHIAREDGERAMEARILCRMAEAYQDTGQTKQAVQLYGRALPIVQEMKDKVNEIFILNNLASAYYVMKRPDRSLQLYKQVLLITKELGDRSGEATTLNDMAAMYVAVGQHLEALKLYEQALPIWQEVGDRASEATTLTSMAFVSYRHLDCVQEAIARTVQAIGVLVDANLPQTIGGQTVDSLQQFLTSLRANTQVNSPAREPLTLQKGIKRSRLQKDGASSRKGKGGKIKQTKGKRKKRT